MNNDLVNLVTTPANLSTLTKLGSKSISEIEPASCNLLTSQKLLKEVFCYSVPEMSTSDCCDLEKELFEFLVNEASITAEIASSNKHETRIGKIRLLQSKLLLFIERIRNLNKFIFGDNPKVSAIPDFYTNRTLFYNEKTLFAAQLISKNLKIKNLKAVNINKEAIKLIATFDALRFVIRNKACMYAIKHPYFSLIEIMLEFEQCWIGFEQKLFETISQINTKYNIPQPLRNIVGISSYVLEGLLSTGVLSKENLAEYDPCVFLTFPKFLVLHLHVSAYGPDSFSSKYINKEIADLVKKSTTSQIVSLIEMILNIGELNQKEEHVINLGRLINQASYTFFADNKEFKQIMDIVLDD